MNYLKALYNEDPELVELLCELQQRLSDLELVRWIRVMREHILDLLSVEQAA